MIFSTDVSITVIYQENFVLNWPQNFSFFTCGEVDTNWPKGEGILETTQSVLNTDFSPAQLPSSSAALTIRVGICILEIIYMNLIYILT